MPRCPHGRSCRELCSECDGEKRGRVEEQKETNSCSFVTMLWPLRCLASVMAPEQFSQPAPAVTLPSDEIARRSRHRPLTLQAKARRSKSKPDAANFERGGMRTYRSCGQGSRHQGYWQRKEHLRGLERKRGRGPRPRQEPSEPSGFAETVGPLHTSKASSVTASFLINRAAAATGMWRCGPRPRKPRPQAGITAKRLAQKAKKTEALQKVPGQRMNPTSGTAQSIAEASDNQCKVLC